MATLAGPSPSLLPHARPPPPPSPSPSPLRSRSRRGSSPASSLLPERRPRHTIWLLIVLLLLVNLSTALYTLPLNRVIELRLCHEHYALHDPSRFQHGGSIPEMLCKIDPVQRRLAWLQGVMETTLVVCGMCVCVLSSDACLSTVLRWLMFGVEDFLVTIPFSFFAERFGVRFVLWCNLVPRVFMSAWAIAVGEQIFVLSSVMVLMLQDITATPSPLNQSLLVLS